ncbi:MAG: winged helix DNA-binding protein [Bacteroidetes bacterium]|nr:winged helix DNA-binding protein [Bacteroidota bacterium]
MKTSTNHDPAMRLAVAIKRLHARLREAATANAIGLPISQIAILKHLRDHGPATASALAVAEHVSQQAIAQNLAALKRAGLVQATRDATDGRKSLISVTKAGHRLFETAIASRNAWLARAINANIGARERPALEKAIELLERLGGSDAAREGR